MDTTLFYALYTLPAGFRELPPDGLRLGHGSGVPPARSPSAPRSSSRRRGGGSSTRRRRAAMTGGHRAGAPTGSARRWRSVADARATRGRSGARARDALPDPSALRQLVRGPRRRSGPSVMSLIPRHFTPQELRERLGGALAGPPSPPSHKNSLIYAGLGERSPAVMSVGGGGLRVRAHPALPARGFWFYVHAPDADAAVPGRHHSRSTSSSRSSTSWQHSSTRLLLPRLFGMAFFIFSDQCSSSAAFGGGRTRRRSSTVQPVRHLLPDHPAADPPGADHRDDLLLLLDVGGLPDAARVPERAEALARSRWRLRILRRRVGRH